MLRGDPLRLPGTMTRLSCINLLKIHLVIPGAWRISRCRIQPKPWIRTFKGSCITVAFLINPASPSEGTRGERVFEARIGIPRVPLASRSVDVTTGDDRVWSGGRHHQVRRSWPRGVALGQDPRRDAASPRRSGMQPICARLIFTHSLSKHCMQMI